MSNDFQNAFDAMKDLNDHVQSCKAVPCDRCQRRQCECGAIWTPTLEPWTEIDPANGRRGMSQHQRHCVACTEKGRCDRALVPFLKSIPKRFRWAIGATADVLLQENRAGRPRVQLTPGYITTALKRASGDCRMLHGESGSGKTSFIVAVVCAFVRRNWKAYAGTRYVAAQWLAGARQRAPLGQGEATEVTEAIEAPLLVLDDLGNDAVDHRNTIADVLFRRHDDDLPTWVTTGYPVAHLENRYGVALIRRLIEDPHSLVEMGKR